MDDYFTEKFWKKILEKGDEAIDIDSLFKATDDVTKE
jgi:hypothetical protein